MIYLKGYLLFCLLCLPFVIWMIVTSPTVDDDN